MIVVYGLAALGAYRIVSVLYRELKYKPQWFKPQGYGSRNGH